MQFDALFFKGQLVSAEIVSTVSSGEIACPPERSILKVGSFGTCRENGTCINSSIKETPFYRAAYDHKTGQYVNRPRQPVRFLSHLLDNALSL